MYRQNRGIDSRELCPGAMDFLNNRYYRINVLFLKAICQWPYDTSMWQRLLVIVFQGHICSLIITQGIKIWENKNDADVMVECFAPMATQAVAIAKTINCMINRRNMILLLERMKKHWSSLTNQHEIDILESYANDGRTLSVAYATFLLGSMTAYLMVPLMPLVLDVVSPLNVSRQRELLYSAEYFVDFERYYCVITLHMYIGTVVEVLCIVASDVMFAVYVQHACGILSIIGYRFENIGENDSLDFDPKPAIEDDVKYKELKDCIKIHQDIIKFVVAIQSSYAKLFLFELGANMLVIVFGLLQLVKKLGQYEEMYRLFQFVFAAYIHLFFNCWPGQKLLNESIKLRDSFYRSEWYTYSLRTRSLLKIVIINGLALPKLSAMNLYDLSMENCSKVVQSSISYFTVLASLQ